mmetsp:Transcript_28271/g.79813  ORF Transcript_28271/g.79813 Transcript_28271/m.79813 type:complete len:249 (+) Transcript_28271:171-917(+)
MPWKLDSVTTKYNPSKPGVFDSSAKFELWSKAELKVGHKTKTNDVNINFKTKKPIEFEAGYDVKKKTTTLKSELELFNDKVDLKVKQVIPGNKWSVVPSPLLEADFEPSKKFQSTVHWDFSVRKGGVKVKSQPTKMHELTAFAQCNSSFKAQELGFEYEIMPRKKWCDEMEAKYSTVKGLELQWETKPTKQLKTDLRANLKTKKITAEMEYKTVSKKPMLKTVLSVSAPVSAPADYSTSATIQAEYKF